MILVDQLQIQPVLDRYDALGPIRAEVRRAFQLAERFPEEYARADGLNADLHESESVILAEMVRVLRLELHVGPL